MHRSELAKLALDVNKCVNVCMFLYNELIQGVFLLLTQFSWDSLWIEHVSDQEKAVTADE